MKFLITVKVNKLSEILTKKIHKKLASAIVKFQKTHLFQSQVCSSYSNTDKIETTSVRRRLKTSLFRCETENLGFYRTDLETKLCGVTLIMLDEWGYAKYKKTEATIDLPLQNQKYRKSATKLTEISQHFKSKRQQIFQSEGVNTYILKTYERQRKLISLEKDSAHNEVEGYEQLTLF